MIRTQTGAISCDQCHLNKTGSLLSTTVLSNGRGTKCSSRSKEISRHGRLFNQDEVDNVSLKREEDSKSFRVSRILPYKLHWASLTIRDQQLDLQRGVEDTSSGLQTPKTSHLFPTVNIEGVCLIYTGNMQLEFSQVSQLMLAPLLFPEVKTDLKQVKVTLL